MIYGHISATATESAFTPVIRKALEILRTTDTTNMHHGKYPLDSDKLILQINEVTTGPKNTNRPEVHKDYIDGQYMVHGHELIGFYPDCKDGSILEDHLADNDVLFYQERNDIHEQMLPMTEGCYAVFFPEDVHRPCCAMNGPEEVKKIVLKIRVDSL